MIKNVRAYMLSWRVLLIILSVALSPGLVACGGSENSNSGSSGSSASATAGSLQVSLTTDPSPAKPGPVSITVEVKDGQGQPVTGAQVTVSIRHVSMTHGGIDGQLLDQGSGKYQANGSFSMAGTWRAKVDVSKQGLAATTATFDIAVR